jgi:tripartite-type tricarboxylate transporter receptor subunit TctC
MIAAHFVSPDDMTMETHMRRLFVALALAVQTFSVASAQEWPNRPVRMVVPQSPGSASDIVTRTVMERVAPLLGQPVIVENRTGAGNTIAMSAVAHAEPDGYTILVNSATHSLVPVTYKDLMFDTLRDLTPVIPLGNTPLVMVVLSSKGYRNVAHFIAEAKAQRGAMNYSSGGSGSITHLAMEAFRIAAGFEAVHVPFRGAPEALTEVLSGRADFYFSPLTAVLPFLKDGKLTALAVSGSNRASALPDVPTLAEAGYPEATYNFWIGLFAPSKTPKAITDRLYRETEKALQSQTLKDRLVAMGFDALPLDQDGFAKLIRSELALNAKVVKAAGIKMN